MSHGETMSVDTEDTPLLSSEEPSSRIEFASLQADLDASSRSSDASIRAILRNFSRSQRDKALNKPGVGQAAFLIRDAVLGEVENPAEGAYNPYDSKDSLRSELAVFCGRVCANRALVQSMYAIVWFLVLLTFVEPPHWCRKHGDDGEGCRVLFEAEGPPADGSGGSVQWYPNSKSMLLSVKQSNALEAIFLGVYALYTVLRIGRDGLDLFIYLRGGTAQVNRLVQLACLAFLIAGLATGFTIYHPYARLLILITMLPSAQRDLRVLVNMLPEIFNVLLLLAVFMGFYAWFGTVMFVDSEQGHLYFSSLIESLWSLYIMVTTANYPDVMMPAYNANRWSALYFVSFMVLSFFFLMNVILASVVNEYDNALEARKSSQMQFANSNLKKAYALMDQHGTGRIDRETVMALFVILNEDFPEFRTLSDSDTKLLFAILDQDGSSTITEDEFMNFGNVLLLEFVKESDYASFVEVYFPKFFQRPGYERFVSIVKSDGFEYVIDLILVLNAVVIGIQSYPELAGQAVAIDKKYWDGSIDTVWEFMETVFTAIYCLEVALKLTVFGHRAYFESAKNVFDFTITLLAVVASAIVYYPNEFSDSRLIRMVVMARVLRLIRLLTAMKRFQLIGAISSEILPKAASVLLILFFLLYAFAVLGVHLYGGLISRDPNNPLSFLVLDTDFSDNDYWANNFNDMISAMNVLFNLLVVNNWTECEVGYEAVTQAKWVRWFFLSFHILGVVLVNNLVIAFIINAFLQQLAIFREHVDEEVIDGEAIIGKRQAFFDATTVTGTKTSLSGRYIARYRRNGSDISEGREQDRLRRLFTQTSSVGSENVTRSDTNGSEAL